MIKRETKKKGNKGRIKMKDEATIRKLHVKKHPVGIQEKGTYISYFS